MQNQIQHDQLKQHIGFHFHKSPLPWIASKARHAPGGQSGYSDFHALSDTTGQSTFDGAQGTDLACLTRQLKGRLNTPAGQLMYVSVHICHTGR